MKSIYKIILAFILIPLTFVGCSDDEIDPIVKASDLRLSDPGINNISLNINTPNDNAFLIGWDDYTTANGDYTVQISNDESFETSADLGTTANSYFAYSMEELNKVLLSWNYIPYFSTPVYVRVSKGNMVSNTINFTVQTYPTQYAVITSPQANVQIDLDEELLDEVAYTFDWNDYAYENGDADVSYKLQFAVPNTDFANTVDVLAYQTEKSLTNAELNNIASDLGLAPEAIGQLAVRVVTMVSAPTGEKLELKSEEVVFSVKTFLSNALYIVGSVQKYYTGNSWAPTEAVKLRYIGNGTTKVFEGYVKIGVDDEFKFIDRQLDWKELQNIYGGINGAQDGVLENSGNSSNIKPGAEGFYYIQVDIDNLTYKLVKMNWGIIGEATPNGWGEETPMTYDFNANTFNWSGALKDGEMKFRSVNTGQTIYGNDWSFNFGVDDYAYDLGAGNINVSAGDYNISVSINVEGKVVKTGL